MPTVRLERHPIVETQTRCGTHDFPELGKICQGERVNDVSNSIGETPDPVRLRRQAIARWTGLANRLGYALYTVAMIVFAAGFLAGWNGGFTAAITVCLVLGSILLAPAIVIGYAIKAAEREEIDLERRRRGSGLH